MRYFLWGLRIAFYILVVVVMALFIDTIVVATSQRTTFLPFGWLTETLRNQGSVIFPVLIGACAALLGYGLYTTRNLVRLTHHLQNAPINIEEDTPPPPDHPYTVVLVGHRFQYMGKRTLPLSGNGTLHLYDFRAQSGISWVTLTKQHPQEWFHASFTTAFDDHLLETQLYDRKSAPPHDDLEGQRIRRIMLRGDDLEQAYFRHTDALDTLHIEHGKPLTVPADHAEAIAWLEAQEKPAQRRVGRAILVRYLAPVASYILITAFIVYTMFFAWLVTTPEYPEFITFTIVDDEIRTDFWVYISIVLMYIAAGTLAAPSYPIPRRVAMIGYGVTALLALPVMVGLDDISLLVAAILVGFAALMIASAGSIARRIVRRIEWRRATIRT